MSVRVAKVSSREEAGKEAVIDRTASAPPHLHPPSQVDLLALEKAEAAKKKAGSCLGSYKDSCGCTPVTKSGLGAFLQFMGANQAEFLAGLTTSLTVVPTAIAFASLGKMSAQTGLTGAWIMALFMAVCGGCPGMVYCNAGAVAVVLVGLMDAHKTAENEFAGEVWVFWAFILSGVITTVLGYLKIATWLRMLPASVMVGFVNGLGIVIFLAQMNKFQVTHDDDDHRRLSGPGGSFGVFLGSPHWVGGSKLLYMLLNVLITMLVISGVPKYALPTKLRALVCENKVVSAIPAALCGIIASMIFEWGIVRGAIGFEGTDTLADVDPVTGEMPVPIWAFSGGPLPGFGEVITDGQVWQTAITISVIGLVESLMTVKLVASINEMTVCPYDVEAIMLGVANVITGVLGGQGGCSEIGLTMINLNSGGKNRLGTVVTAVLTFIWIVGLNMVINLIPIAGLAGIMFVVCFHCFDFSSLTILMHSVMPLKYRHSTDAYSKINRIDAVVILVVTLVTPLTDLAIAVVAGCAVAAIGFAWETADRLEVEGPFVQEIEGETVSVYKVSGQVYYASADLMLAAFDNKKDDEDIVEVRLADADIHDFSAMQALNGLGDSYAKLGKTLRLRQLRHKSKKVLTKGHGLMTAFNGDAMDGVPIVTCPRGKRSLGIENIYGTKGMNKSAAADPALNSKPDSFVELVAGAPATATKDSWI